MSSSVFATTTTHEIPVMRVVLPCVVVLVSLLLGCGGSTKTSSSTRSTSLAPGLHAIQFHREASSGWQTHEMDVVVCCCIDASLSKTSTGSIKEVTYHGMATIDGEKTEVFRLEHTHGSGQVTIDGKSFELSKGQVFVVTRRPDEAILQIDMEVSDVGKESKAVADRVRKALGS